MRVVSPTSTTIVSPSAQRLREALAGVDSAYTLNWGSTGGDANTVEWINNPASVSLASHKVDALQFFENQQIPAPMLMQEAAVRNGVMYGRRYIARPDRHAGGAYLRIINTLDDLDILPRNYTHFTEVLLGDQEFRVHVIAGKVVKISQKVDGQGIIRSRRAGWRFVQPRISSDERGPVRDVARLAVQEMALDFGAVDVLRNSSNRQVWVLEVNTAPSLIDPSSNTFDKYVSHIKENWAAA